MGDNSGFGTITYALYRMYMGIKRMEAFGFWLMMGNQEEQLRQKKEDEFYEELANRFGRIKAHHCGKEKGAHFGTHGACNCFASGQIMPSLISKEEAKRRYLELHQSAFPVTPVGEIPNLLENQEIIGYDIGRAVARASAFLDEMQGDNTAYLATASEENARGNLTKMTNNADVSSQADAEALWNALGNQTGEEGILTASVGNGLFFGSNKYSAQSNGGVSLLFNGSTLSLMDNGNTVFSAPAVSGRPLADGSFDYSVARQKMGSTGPIPAGNYKINPQATQWWTSQSFMQRTAAIFHKGTWPGGPIAWGVARTWITPEGANVYGRSGFTIHGGFEPGSAGCIDLYGRELDFFRTLQNYGNLNSIPLQVKY